MNNYCETIKITGQERTLRPTLLQRFQATVSSKTFSSAVYSDARYIEPARKIVFNHPIVLEPGDAAFYLQDQGYIFYGEQHFYRRCVDGKLIERVNEIEPDYAAEMDLNLFTDYKERWGNVSLLGIDLCGNFYCMEYDKYHDILVGSRNGAIYGKFHLMGGPILWYLTPNGKVCVLTSNGASDSGKRKNILRLYRLDLSQ